MRSAAFAAIAARLAAQLPAVPVERNRRAMMAAEDLPRLVVRDGGHSASAELGAGEVTYTVEAMVEGYATGADEDALAAAINELHAETVAALIGAELAVGTAGLTTWLLEDALEIDLATAAEAEAAVGAFYLTLRFDLAWPIGSGPFTTTTI